MCVIVSKHLPNFFMFSDDSIIHILWDSSLYLFSIFTMALGLSDSFYPTLPKIG